MARKIGSSIVFHVVRRVAEAPFTRKKEVLCNELKNLKDSITDQEIWEIIDFFSKKKVRSPVIIAAVIESGAQSHDSTLQMLKVFGYKEELCQKALTAYESSVYFHQRLFAAVTEKPLLRERLKNFSIGPTNGKFC